MNYLWGNGDGTPAWHGRKLQVRIGPSLDSLTPYKVNDDSNPHFIDSPYFTGNICIRVKNFNGVTPDGSDPIKDSNYFGERKRLFSIQVQGRFKHEHTADDVLFGAEFVNKINPPTGAWLAVKFANMIDPALLTDLYSDKPWLYSPMLCAMNIVNVVKADHPLAGNSSPPAKELKGTEPRFQKSPAGPETSAARSKVVADHAKGKAPCDPVKSLGEWSWGAERELQENNELLLPERVDDLPFPNDGISERRRYFNNKGHREKMVFKPDYVYNLEIFAPFMDFNTFDLTLGINVNCLRYINHQPIRLICKSLSKNIPFYIIEFDLLGDGPLPPPGPDDSVPEEK
ncbi:hypothetical protein HDV05_007365 [Chytridiales sp. JEL 0842]|nr:hypothetical protein HDV05_007365 [Chytridiales sp. JEL 0842]